MLTIYTKNVCPYCVKAKNYLNMKGIAYETINIEEDRDGRNFLVEQGLRSVPQIFVGKKLSRVFPIVKIHVGLIVLTKLPLRKSLLVIYEAGAS